jgi:hypothetical protein
MDDDEWDRYHPGNPNVGLPPHRTIFYENAFIKFWFEPNEKNPNPIK